MALATPTIPTPTRKAAKVKPGPAPAGSNQGATTRSKTVSTLPVTLPEQPQTLAMIVRRMALASLDQSVEEVTEDVLAFLDDQGRQVLLDLARPLVRNEVVMHRRQRAAVLEKRLYNGTAADPIASRRELLATDTYVPGRARTTTGQMTVEDHLARIAYLESLVAASITTIAWHHEAIASIQAAGVACLDDIPEAV